MYKIIIILLVAALSWHVIWADGRFPSKQQQGDVVYLVGGINANEIREIRSEINKWPLCIEFPEYLSTYNFWIEPVQLIIKNKINGNTIFYGSIDGPIILMKLPPGRYELVTTFHNQVRARDVDIVKGKTIQIEITWNPSRGIMDFPYYQPWGFWF